MKNIRLERINSEIQKAISYILDNELRDPQINGLISVCSVQTTPDLAYSYVYISCIGAKDKEEVLNRIKGAGGFIRGELSKRVKLRITPRLEFRLDNSEEYADKINNILKTITYSTPADDEQDKDDNGGNN